MRTNSIREDDILLCNVRGQRFFAIVQKPMAFVPELKKKAIKVEGLNGNPIPSRHIKARQIERHWRLSRQSQGKEEE